MKVTVVYLVTLNALIRAARRNIRNDDMDLYRENISEAYGMIKALYMMDFIGEKTFSDITDKLWKTIELTKDDFNFEIE
jgi:hypothetical protein